jgi:hypothetical protein
MTIAISAPATDILAEFTGGTTSQYTMMIGVGLQKDSDAVYFQYLEGGETQALINQANGKPIQTFKNVRVSEISIAEEVGTFKSTKLNLIIEGSEGTKVLMTTGLTTFWAQAVITALMGMMGSTQYDMSTPFTLWAKKGDQGLRPCFANIYIDGERVSDNHMFEQLRDARSDRDTKLQERIMRDAVEILSAEISGVPTEVSVLTELRALPSEVTPQEEF